MIRRPRFVTRSIPGRTPSGTWALYETADRMLSSRQEPFLITETNAQAIGPAWVNEPAYDGQWRQAAWALVSRGATMIEYWHWHTLHFGAETSWGGILPHSSEPGRVYRQLADLGAEFDRAGGLVASLCPDADVALIYSTDTKWSLEGAPMLHGESGEPDRRSYRAIFDAFYRGVFDAGLQARIVHPSQVFAQDSDPPSFAARHPVLIAAGLLIASDAQLTWLDRYAAAGGHLVLGILTGYGDEEARARVERKPAFLTTAAGVWYDEFSTIDAPLPVRSVAGSVLKLPADAHATRWIDGLQADDAEVLVEYQHPHFSRWPAVTTRPHHAGRVTYVGTVPDLRLASSLARWLVHDPADAWRRASPTQTVTGATAGDGAKLRFVHNWSWEPSAFRLPSSVRDGLSGQELKAGAELALGAWDVRVLVER